MLVGESLGNLTSMLMEALWKFTFTGQEKEPMQFPTEESMDLLYLPSKSLQVTPAFTRNIFLFFFNFHFHFMTVISHFRF